jgi:hypothetical protein
MLTLLGSAYLIAKMLGFAVILATLLAAFIFHLGWRNSNPDGFWPLFAVLGFGGVLLAGAGLIIGSVLAVIGGVLCYLVSLFVGRGAPRPAV